MIVEVICRVISAALELFMSKATLVTSRSVRWLRLVSIGLPKTSGNDSQMNQSVIIRQNKPAKESHARAETGHCSILEAIRYVEGPR